uniref:Uncharacterized protein n=1 Tax=Anguilla anguilla TaxID=7936 RepID=A0A0E9U2I5_ANGAN
MPLSLVQGLVVFVSVSVLQYWIWTLNLRKECHVDMADVPTAFAFPDKLDGKGASGTCKYMPVCWHHCLNDLISILHQHESA